MSSETPEGGRELQQWEIRAALWAYSRAADDDTRHPAGVALQTFYRHFGTKDELVLAIMEEKITRSARVKRTVAASIDDPVDKLRWLVATPILGPCDEGARRSLQWAARECQRLMTQMSGQVFDVHRAYREALREGIDGVIEAGLGDSGEPAFDATILHSTRRSCSSVS